MVILWGHRLTMIREGHRMALKIEAEIFAADMAGSHMERQLERILTVLERQEEIKVKEDALPTGKASKDFQDSSTKASVEITFTFQ